MDVFENVKLSKGLSDDLKELDEKGDEKGFFNVYPMRDEREAIDLDI